MGYKYAKNRVIKDLLAGNYQHEARADIDNKNKLLLGDISAEELAKLIGKSNGTQHSCSPHHSEPSIDVHVIVTGDWYIKFYFLDPNTVFISVH